MPNYKPSELAYITGIHPNTVRLYERLGFITKAERLKNNYRVFNEKHIYQVKICRLIFNNGFTNKRIRKASLAIMGAASKWDIPLCGKCVNEYLSIIENEISRALNTVDILKNWMENKVAADSGQRYNKEYAAQIIGTTKESVRNWERNGLVTLKCMARYKRRSYSDSDINRMRIIYMLLQTGYSLSMVHRCLHLYDQGYKTRALDTLVVPEETDDIVLIGDHWLEALRKVEHRAKEILELIDEMKTL